MRRARQIAALAWVPLLLASAAWALERFPPPDFESGYGFPDVQIPKARSLALEYLDVAVLLGALALAAYLVHKKRSRSGIVWLGIFSLAYFGFWRKGCVCAIGSIQNVALALADRSYHVPWMVIVFFVAPLAFALFFGRTFCAAVCPHGALQDLVLVKPVRVPQWLEQALGVLAYVYLGAVVLCAATGSAFLICQYDPFIAIFRLTGGYDMFILAASFLIVGMFVGRPYCRYLCPLGVLLRWASQVNKWRVTIYPDHCVQCGLCEESCPYGAISPAAEEPPRTFDAAGDKKARTFALAALPVLFVVFGWIGSRVATPMSLSHPTVSLAERIHLEDEGKAEGETDASTNFRESGESADKLFESAAAISRSFGRGGWLWGLFIALVLGVRLATYSSWRPQADYEADRGSCVACTRCYSSCPRSRRRGKAAAADDDGADGEDDAGT